MGLTIKNQSPVNTQAPVIWSDINHNFQLDGRGNLQIDVNVDAVMDSIDNILGTTPGERVMLPEFASRLKFLVFEPIDDNLIYLITNEVKTVIERWDDRVIVNSVNVYGDPDNTFVSIVADISIVGYTQTFQYTKQYDIQS